MDEFVFKLTQDAMDAEGVQTSKRPEPGSETTLKPTGEPETGPPSEPGPKPRAGNNAQEDRVRAKDTTRARKKARARSRTKEDTSRAGARNRTKVKPQDEIDRVQTGVRARACEKVNKSPEPTDHTVRGRHTDSPGESRRGSIFGDNGQPGSLFGGNGLGDSRGSTPQPCRRQRQSRSQEKSQNQIPNQNRNHTRERTGTDNAPGVTTEHETWRATPPLCPPNRDPTDQVATTTKPQRSGQYEHGAKVANRAGLRTRTGVTPRARAGGGDKAGTRGAKAGVGDVSTPEKRPHPDSASTRGNRCIETTPTREQRDHPSMADNNSVHFTHENNSVTFQDNNIAKTIKCEWSTVTVIIQIR